MLLSSLKYLTLIVATFTAGYARSTGPSHMVSSHMMPFYWAIALNFCTPGVEEQWNSSGVSYKICGILQGLSQKSWNSLGVKH